MTLAKTPKGWNKLALRYPEAEAGTSCNRTAYRARKKGFLFVGTKDDSYNLMVKLGASRADAKKLAKKDPRFAVGSTGWVTATFQAKETPPRGLLEKWIDESYREVAPKPLVEMLGDGKKPRSKTKAAKKRTAKTKAAKKRTAKKAQS